MGASSDFTEISRNDRVNIYLNITLKQGLHSALGIMLFYCFVLTKSNFEVVPNESLCKINILSAWCLVEHKAVRRGFCNRIVSRS